MKYAYARVSTRKQSRDGNGLDEQIAKLQAVGFDELVVEEFTGTTTKRPCLDALIERLQSGDTLIVTKLDRFARTAVEGGAIVKELHERGVTIHIMNMGVADNTPMGRLMVTMLLAFAEFERDMIVERTQGGRKRTGNLGGRPRVYSRAQRELAMKLLAEGHSYRQVEESTGISKSTLIREHRSHP